MDLRPGFTSFEPYKDIETCFLEVVIAKATKLELYKREIEIIRMINEGYAKDTMCEELSVKFNCSTRSISDQHRSILKNVMKLADEDRDILRATIMLRNDEIYRKAVTERKYKTALDANVAQAKLGGLFEAVIGESKAPEFIEVSERAPLKVVGNGEQS